MWVVTTGKIHFGLNIWNFGTFQGPKRTLHAHRMAFWEPQKGPNRPDMGHTVSIKACLAHWNMPQIKHSTEAICYYCRFESTNYAFSNCDISETKKATGDPLVPKFSYRRGLSPTLSRKWPRATLSPSFGTFFERNHFFGVKMVS